MRYNENEKIDYIGLKTSFSKRVVKDHDLYSEISKNKHVVFLAPHPDDEIVGCGGLIQKLLKSGSVCEVIYCTSSIRDSRGKEAASVMNEMGVDYISFLELADQNINLDSKKVIVNELLKEKRDLICVPSIFEIHDDHLNVTKAVLDYCKVSNDDVKILTYEVWVPQLNNGYVSLTKEEYIRKIKLLRKYKTQYNKYRLNLLAQMQHAYLLHSHKIYEVFNLLDKKQFSLIIRRKELIRI